ncbi:hypothetical protein KP509_1Z045200 [Ceratopteris richardii]|nr:hypothetical protein KP509_1Z045200 [Ceratopteris richardii]
MSNADGMSQLMSDKLDKKNFHAWRFKMTNFLMGKGYWKSMEGNVSALQLKNELHTLEKMGIICESLASFGVNVDDDDDDDKVEFRTSIQTRENIPNFVDLVSMLIIEEKIGRGRGRGFRSRRGHNNQDQGQQQNHAGGRGHFRGRGRQRVHKNFQKNDLGNDNKGCSNCGKPRHFERDWRLKNQNNRRQQNNYASTSANDYGKLFMVQHHMMNTMTTYGSKSNGNVWYMESSASNHMTSHAEWFSSLLKWPVLGYVETGDDTSHPIEHRGNIVLSMEDGKVKHLADVMHVPNITKNLVFFGQMVGQGLQVRFNVDGLYVEDYK